MKENKKITPNIKAAMVTLREYKRGKSELERRIAYEREFWQGISSPSSRSSAWLFNSLLSKHADVTDNMPSCSCLPREECDEQDAQLLTEIIPIITDRCSFKRLYSENSWNKLKYGAGIYGVFWNNSLEDGLGDIDIRALRLEDVFWEPGAKDIESSKNLFVCGIWDIYTLESTYQDLKISDIKREVDNVGLEVYGGMLDTREKCVVVDWYYKKFDEYGIQRLHLCKFVGGKILYSSENDENCAHGWYEHGKYPVIVDSLYPDENNLFGLGIISLAKNAQLAIDKIDEDIMNYANWSSKARFWAKRSLGVKEEDFCDLSKSIVEVEGDIDEEKLKQIEIAKLDEMVLTLRSMKVEELKETTGTRDFLQGGTTGGVVAATAIQRLQDSGAKYSRDGIDGSCFAYSQMIALVIELIRQFYNTPRYFRIKGECGDSRYICYSGILGGVNKSSGALARRPHFDLEITTTKKSNTYAESANEFAKSLYDSGAFKPENARETLIMLELMSFEGIGKIKGLLMDSLKHAKEVHSSADIEDTQKSTEQNND